MLANKFKIGSYIVSRDSEPFIIAEAGSNFNQDLDIAKKLIDIAKEAGAQAVKFQLFDAEALYPDKGEMYEIFKTIQLNKEWVPILNNYSKSKGIIFLASAFDFSSVDVLDDINVPAFKIASSETTNLPLLSYIASKKKPLLISTGMCDSIDVEEAVKISIQNGVKEICLMQCGAQYPLEIENSNLKVLNYFSDRFTCPIGLSDHTLGSVQSITAIGLGATVFEKHFTFDKSAEGPDHFYALEPKGLTSYISSLKEAHLSLGSYEKEMLQIEREVGRREGLYYSTDLKKGAKLSVDSTYSDRPAIGVRSRYIHAISHAALRVNVKKGETVRWKHLSFGD